MASEEARIKMKENMERFKAAQTIEIDWKSILNKDVYSIIVENSNALKCSKELIIFPLLASIACHMSVNATVKISPSWSENIIIWNVIAARRGERKSVSMNRMVRANENVMSIKREGVENTPTEVTILDAQKFLNEDLLKNDAGNSSRLIMVDDVEICFNSIQKHSLIWNPVFLSGEYEGRKLSQNKNRNMSSNFTSTCQAINISEMLDSSDSTRLVDRLLVVCAPEVNFNNEAVEKAIPLETVLQSVRDTHEGHNVTYTFTTEGEAEFQRVLEKLHILKQRYVDDETRRGCINQSATHIARLCGVITALTNAVISPSSVATCCVIERELVRKVFLLTLLLMRQKFALLPHIVGISPEVDHCLLLYQSEVDKTKDKPQRNTDDDIIEITLDGNDEPIARILPRSETNDAAQNSFQITNFRTATSSDIMILRDGYTETHRLDSRRSPEIRLDRGPELMNIDQNSHRAGYSSSVMSQRMVGSQQQPIQRQHIQPNMRVMSNNLSPSIEQTRPRQPPPLKIRPNQIFLNRARAVPPRRMHERSKSLKNDIYSCTDEMFIQQCSQKIKKCMLTHGSIITSSYACQYRLFPPVPLVQRTSSPRTTHPSWAAIKFFERLQKLGLGNVVVFRSQSVKFQKKTLEEMSESARQLLRTVGVTEEEFEQALSKNSGLDVKMDNNCNQSFDYLFGPNHEGQRESVVTGNKME